jgi:hypothetical protein
LLESITGQETLERCGGTQTFGLRIRNSKPQAYLHDWEIADQRRSLAPVNQRDEDMAATLDALGLTA